MVIDQPFEVGKSPLRRRKLAFTEAPAWEAVGGGWRQLHGNFQGLGYSIEWHDFSTKSDLDWSRSFHPDSLEICLNLCGTGFVGGPGKRAVFGADTVGLYPSRGRTARQPGVWAANSTAS